MFLVVAATPSGGMIARAARGVVEHGTRMCFASRGVLDRPRLACVLACLVGRLKASSVPKSSIPRSVRALNPRRAMPSPPRAVVTASPRFVDAWHRRTGKGVGSDTSS